MTKSIAVSWTSLRLLVLSQIISVAFGEIQLECVQDLKDYQRVEWTADTYFTWNYAARAENLPAIFQGKLEGTGIFYADGLYGYNSFTRDDGVEPTPTPGYLYIKYYLHRTNNASDLSLIARPAKGDNGFAVNLPITDDFRWQEQLIEIDIEAANSNGFWVGIQTQNMILGQYLLIDTIALIQGEILSTAADAAVLCSQQLPASLPEPRNP